MTAYKVLSLLVMELKQNGYFIACVTTEKLNDLWVLNAIEQLDCFRVGERPKYECEE